MGRLTLNILLSFAQFEREIISERTRDKIAAARRKGKWSGGKPLLGYDILSSPARPKLVVNEDEAARVRRIFELYLEHQALLPVVKELAERGWCNKAWVPQRPEQRGTQPVTQHVVIRWVRVLPAKRDECWFLMTDLDAGPARISALYGQRMTIEQLFRDHKSKRNGWSLRDTHLSTPERLDRLLLVLALAYLLLVGLGLHCRRHYRPGSWCSKNKDQTLSDFAIARAMLGKVAILATTAFRLLLAATVAAVPNWG